LPEGILARPMMTIKTHVWKLLNGAESTQNNEYSKHDSINHVNSLPIIEREFFRLRCQLMVTVASTMFLPLKCRMY